jgi:3-isopropylmalate dehydrogenase
MALRYSFDKGGDATFLETAVQNVLLKGLRTKDLMQSTEGKEVSTSQMGDAILNSLEEMR